MIKPHLQVISWKTAQTLNNDTEGMTLRQNTHYYWISLCGTNKENFSFDHNNALLRPCLHSVEHPVSRVQDIAWLLCFVHVPRNVPQSIITALQVPRQEKYQRTSSLNVMNNTHGPTKHFLLITKHAMTPSQLKWWQRMKKKSKQNDCATTREKPKIFLEKKMPPKLGIWP